MLNHKHNKRFTGLLLGVLLLGVACGAPKPTAPRRMLTGTLSLPNEAFLKFAERVKPDMVVMGAFGAPQWTAEKDPRAWLAQWKMIFERMHRSGIKVVGMIELLNVGADVAAAERWLEFYEKRWDEKLLGERPSAKGHSLLEQRAWLPEKQRGAYAPRACAANPHWHEVEKALVGALIDAGIDGFITHRNMYGQCGCERCRDGLRKYLAANYKPAELKSRFSIANLAAHKLPHIYGFHREHATKPTALELEGMKFARRQTKECFDEVFLQYARGRKKDLIVAQWNHIPHFDEMRLDDGHIPGSPTTTFVHACHDERWSLPADVWGRGEDFFWYCNWGTTQKTQLNKQHVADITLYAKLIRSQARGRPYVINKYDFYRPRNMMAEAAALGMIAGAIAVPHGTKEDADVMARYCKFLDEHAEIFQNQNGESTAKVLLVYPRTASHAGRIDGIEMIEVAGRTMIADHVQFDFVPDDLLDKTDLKKYRAIVASDSEGLTQETLEPFHKAGGRLIALPRGDDLVASLRWKKLGAAIVAGLEPRTGGKPAAAPFRVALHQAMGIPLLQTTAPYTLEVHAYRQSGRLIVHLVNYNRSENATGKSVVAREAPIDVEPAQFQLALPQGTKVKRVRFLDPDAQDEQKLAFQQRESAVNFQTPTFKVYGVCVVELMPTP